MGQTTDNHSDMDEWKKPEHYAKWKKQNTK